MELNAHKSEQIRNLFSLPRSATFINGVLPRASLWLMSASLSMSSFAILTWSVRWDQSNSLPRQFHHQISFQIKKVATRFSLFWVAKFNAESPLSFVAFTLAPFSMRTRTRSSFAFEELTAFSSGENPTKTEVFNRFFEFELIDLHTIVTHSIDVGSSIDEHLRNSVVLCK